MVQVRPERRRPDQPDGGQEPRHAGEDPRRQGQQAGGDGGGLFNADGGRVRIVDSAFIGNSAGQTGGGIANAGDLILIDTLFANNTPDDVSRV